MKRSCENTDDPEAQDPTYQDIDNWLIHYITFLLFIFSYEIHL